MRGLATTETSQPNNHEGTDVNRSYGTPPSNRPLDQYSEAELREIERRHFERYAKKENGGSK